ncbi:MAG: hypothetical protein K1X89_25280 [Myxococcaceae bacterium]|nr:hypothetical protein [Myxococcaceae bacterium]
MRIGGILATLVCLHAPAALADGLIGVPPYPPRNVSRPDGSYAEFIQVGAGGEPSATITTAGTTISVDALLFYVEEVQSSGNVTLTVSTGAASVSSVLSVGQPGWTEWRFVPPVPVGNSTLTLTPDPGVAVTFRHLRHEYEADHQLGGEAAPLLFPTGLRDGGPPYDVSFVFRRSGGRDPYALPGCSAADSDPVGGFPYVRVFKVPIDPASGLSQSLVFPPGFRSFGGGSCVQTGLAYASPEASLSVSYSAIDGGPGPWVPLLESGLASRAPVVADDDGGVSAPFTLSIRSDGGLAAWAMFDTGPELLDPCHPAARATFGGARARAVGFGAGADLATRFSASAALPRWPDDDGDGYGARGAQRWVCSFVARSAVGLVVNGEDCDDRSFDTKPGAGELCNGRDDDCDGLVDADDTLEATPACELSRGVCAGARHDSVRCRGGRWDACGSEYGPRYEAQEVSCDGLDNDCDGRTDDVGAGPPCFFQLGVCAGARARVCTSERWLACTDADYGPDFQAVETQCDGLDNDCDGRTDGADFDLPSTLCEKQLGVCARAVHAATDCTAAGWAECPASRYPADYEPIEGRCDGLDNDCDGVVDEGCRAAPPPARCGCGTTLGVWPALGLLVWWGRRRRAHALTLVAVVLALPARAESVQTVIVQGPTAVEVTAPSAVSTAHDGRSFLVVFNADRALIARLTEAGGQSGRAEDLGPPFARGAGCKPAGRCVVNLRGTLSVLRDAGDGGWGLGPSTGLVKAFDADPGGWVVLAEESSGTVRKVDEAMALQWQRTVSPFADRVYFIADDEGFVALGYLRGFTTTSYITVIAPDGGQEGLAEILVPPGAIVAGQANSGSWTAASVAPREVVLMSRNSLWTPAGTPIPFPVSMSQRTTGGVAFFGRQGDQMMSLAVDRAGLALALSTLGDGGACSDEAAFAAGADAGVACWSKTGQCWNGPCCKVGCASTDAVARPTGPWVPLVADAVTHLTPSVQLAARDGGVVQCELSLERGGVHAVWDLGALDGGSPALFPPGTTVDLVPWGRVLRSASALTTLSTSGQPGPSVAIPPGASLALAEDGYLRIRLDGGTLEFVQIAASPTGFTETRPVVLRRAAPVGGLRLTSSGRGVLVVWDEQDQRFGAVVQRGLPLPAVSSFGPAVPVLGLGTSADDSVWQVLQRVDGGVALVTWTETDAGLVAAGSVELPVHDCLEPTLIGGTPPVLQCVTGAEARLALSWVDPDGGLRAIRGLDGASSVREVGAARSGEGLMLAVARRALDGGSQLDLVRVDSLALGSPCASGEACRSGWCVDGVCCDDPCGGGLDGDCLACSATRGAPADGRCAPVLAGTVCRLSQGPCDLPDVCDGLHASCLPRTMSDGTVCEVSGRQATRVCSAGKCLPLAPAEPPVLVAPAPAPACGCGALEGAWWPLALLLVLAKRIMAKRE